MFWPVKVAAQWAFSWLPRGESLNYACSSWLGHWPRPIDPHYPRRHLAAVRDHLGDPASLTFLEFGAGWDLQGPLVFAGLGVKRQILLDVRPLARAELIDDLLRSLPSTLQVSYPARDAGEPTMGYLRRGLGIEYHAPADARSMPWIMNHSIDVVTTTSTLEHIPPRDLAAILVECRRILRHGGLLISHVACDDHYAAADPRITRLNFLRYSPAFWAMANPPVQYQSRLRYPDYVRLIQQAGFKILEESPRRATEAELRGFRSAWHPHRSFGGYSDDDLTITHGYFVAQA